MNKSGTSLSEKEILNIINIVDKDLLHKTKIPFTLNSKWNLNFPDQAGVYAGFVNSKLIYIGETGNIKARMKDLRRTYNHSLRKKIGKLKLNGILEGNKYSEEIEAQLDSFMIKNLTITAHALSFGRIEVETRLIAKYKEQLLNSPNKRG